MSFHARLKAVHSDAGRRLRICPYGHTTKRGLVRGLCLLLAVVALSPIASGTFLSAVVPALSPFVAMTAILTTRTFHALAWLGLIVGATVLLRRRTFCRWVCPAGLCLDGASWLGRRGGRRTIRCPSLGYGIVGLTLGGVCLGYPFLLWLDPLARFAGLSALGDGDLGAALVLSVGGFAALLVLDLLWPHLWCTRLCPLGAFQDLLSGLAGSLRRVAAASASLPPAPTLRGRQSRRSWRWYPSRRTFLTVAAGASCAALARSSHKDAPRPLRPPGALEEFTFRGVCTRCGNCLRACPSGVVAQDLGPNGWASLLTPVLDFQRDYCREDCVKCTEVCPSGALTRIPREMKASVRLGLPRVDMGVCLLGEDRECSACRSRCPYNAIRYVWSEVDYTLTPHIDQDKCTGCGACEVACPTTPRKAILILPA